MLNNLSLSNFEVNISCNTRDIAICQSFWTTTTLQTRTQKLTKTLKFSQKTAMLKMLQLITTDLPQYQEKIIWSSISAENCVALYRTLADTVLCNIKQYPVYRQNCLPNNKIYLFTKRQNFSVVQFQRLCRRQYKCNLCNQFCNGKSWKHWRKRNAGYQHFLLFPQCFQKISLTDLF